MSSVINPLLILVGKTDMRSKTLHKSLRFRERRRTKPRATSELAIIMAEVGFVTYEK